MPTINDIPKEKRVDLKDKIAIVYDDGYYVELASTLSKSFKKVYYYNNWKGIYPTSCEYYIGYGVEGIETITNFWDYVDKADIIIFPGVFYGDLQVHLEKMGKLVWGSRRGGEMELYRDKMKEYMKKIGLFTTPYTVVKGITNLREYLKDHKDVYIKQNLTRGDFETTHSINYDLVKPVLDEWEHKLGPAAEIKEFLVENALNDAVEAGLDLYTINGLYPTETLVGIEVKDLGYVGKIMKYEDISKKLTDFYAKISPALKKYGYRGFISNETRIAKNTPPYMVDLTCRMPSPPGELYQLMYKNLAEIIWYGSQGILIDPVTEKPFGVEAKISSDWVENNWQSIEFDYNYRQYMKFNNACYINEKCYISPVTGCSDIGAVVTEGDTIEEAVELAKKVADTIKGHQVCIEIGSIDRALQQFKELEKFGVKIL